MEVPCPWQARHIYKDHEENKEVLGLGFKVEGSS